MSIDEKENRPESDNRAIHETNCTIYVGRVRIIIDPRLNADASGIAEAHVTENHHDGPAAKTPPKQTDFVGVRSTSTLYYYLLYSLISMILHCTSHSALQPASTNHYAVLVPTKNK